MVVTGCGERRGMEISRWQAKQSSELVGDKESVPSPFHMPHTLCRAVNAIRDWWGPLGCTGGRKLMTCCWSAGLTRLDADNGIVEDCGFVMAGN